MKVLMIDYFLPGALYSFELCNYLKKHVDLTMFTRKTVKKAPEKIKLINVLYSGEHVKVVKLFEYINGICKLFMEIHRNRYDVIHIQSFAQAGIEIPLYRILRKRIKFLVHTVHNVLPHEEKKGDRKLYRKLYDSCDCLIVHNETCKKLLISEFGIDAKKIVIIPFGVYTTRVQKTRARKDSRFTFLMFGMIRNYKGVDILLDAVSRIPEVLRGKMRFIIAGKQYKNQNPTDYEAMIKRLGIASCVEFIPQRIEEDKLGVLYADVDACVFPYREIYGSGSLFMAYAYGKPVIVSNLPTFIEETENGKTGLLFNSENPEQLAKALIIAADWTENEINQYKDEISMLIDKKYNWEMSAQKTYKAYCGAKINEERKHNSSDGYL